MSSSAVGGFMDAMKAQPLALALSIIIIVLLYLLHDIRKQELQLASDYRTQVSDMLTRFCGTGPH